MGIALPREFIWRRLHSLMGLWLVLFLTEHLITNSQAALLLGDNARGFVNMVNLIHNLPYLEAIELFLLGVPILIHLVWGVKYALTSKSNTRHSDGTKPSLPYGRNRAYRWQRITSWILLVGIIAHVTKFRFLDYPQTIRQESHNLYMVRISQDEGLATLKDRLGFKIYDEDDLEYVSFLRNHSLLPNQVFAVAPNFGTASLLTVRDTFKSPTYLALYTIFVLAACFHAFNGFWTFLITWGALLAAPAQRWGVRLSIALMSLIAFLGLAAVWGTYWINLKS